MLTGRRLLGLAIVAAVVFGIATPPVAAGETSDDWYAFYVSGGKAGYLHITTTEIEEGGRTLWKTETEVSFSLARLGSPLTIVQKETVVEDADGKVIRFSSAADQGGGEQVTTGTVADGKITIDQMGMKRVVNYPEGAVGPVASQKTLLGKTGEVGTKISVKTFTTQAPDQTVVSTTTVGEMEKVDVLGRVVMLRKLTETNTLMPMQTHLWINDEGKALVIEMNMGMGPFRMLKTEKEFALAKSEPVEVFTTTFIEPNRIIAEPRSLKRALYRIGNKDGTAPALYEGEGQTIRAEAEGGAIELEVVVPEFPADREAFTLPVAKEGLENYLEESPSLEINDPLIMKLAAEAVGEETDAVKAAVLIEKFVDEKIKEKNLNVGWATAAEVAQTLEGDCSEHAVLCAAIARARGLPSRVAVGLVYLPPAGGIEEKWKNGIFGYHLWAEVLVADGVWMPLDAAIKTYDATHIALAKSDLSAVNPGIEMGVAIIKAMGSLTIEVIEP